MSNGIIVVATNKIHYYNAACQLAESIKDYTPDFDVTLFTEQKFIDNKSKIFNNVITDIPTHENHSVNKRTKMWAMANSPYDTTLYLDADMEIVNSEFSTVFEQIKDNDLLWTKITEDRKYAFAFITSGDVAFTYHGGVCLYKSSAKPFMMDWYNRWKQQANFEWWPGDDNQYPKNLINFDQFTLWWLLNKEGDKYKYLKHDFFEDDTRWNAVVHYSENLGHGKSPIIRHYAGCNNH